MTMTRDEARDYINAHPEQVLQPDRNGGYICECGSGSGASGTGLAKQKDGIHFKCFACGFYGDVIDQIGKLYHLEDYNEKLKKACELYGITLETGYQNQPKNKQNTQHTTHNTATQPAEETDFSDFFFQASQNIERTRYHRGISLETLKAYKIGYAPEWIHPKKPKDSPSPRLIIPLSEYSYTARYTGEGDFIDSRGKKLNKAKVKGRDNVSWTFNREAIIKATQPIFITEGEIDALSIIDVGGEAVALGSLQYVRAFLDELKETGASQPFIICLDNDEDQKTRETVAKAGEQLKDGLNKLNINCYEIDILSNCKDANQALIENREHFKNKVLEAIQTARNAEDEALEAKRQELRRESVRYSLQDFLKNIETSGKNSAISTGFKKFDSALDGGLYPGLYIIGAISSLGKTTFTLQLADQIAQAGKDVLIFSMEMARDELIAKSVSRLTYRKALERDGNFKNAKTTRGILTGARYENYSQNEVKLIEDSVLEYSSYAEHIYITEALGDVKAEDIEEKVKRHVKLVGEAPVVIIDYLQIIAPADTRATDKQNTDQAVLKLKRLSRDYSIPVIGISSFNRESYTSPVNLSAFKESGAIEYTSDVLLGIQYNGMDFEPGEADQSKQRLKRISKLRKDMEKAGRENSGQDIQVKILKNRNGSKGAFRLTYYPMFNCFTEEETALKDGEDYEEWLEEENSNK